MNIDEKENKLDLELCRELCETLVETTNAFSMMNKSKVNKDRMGTIIIQGSMYYLTATLLSMGKNLCDKNKTKEFIDLHKEEAMFIFDKISNDLLSGEFNDCQK